MPLLSPYIAWEGVVGHNIDRCIIPKNYAGILASPLLAIVSAIAHAYTCSLNCKIPWCGHPRKFICEKVENELSSKILYLENFPYTQARNQRGFEGFGRTPYFPSLVFIFNFKTLKLAQHKLEILEYLETLEYTAQAAAGAVTNFTLRFRCVNLLESRVYMMFTNH